MPTHHFSVGHKFHISTLSTVTFTLCAWGSPVVEGAAKSPRRIGNLIAITSHSKTNFFKKLQGSELYESNGN